MLLRLEQFDAKLAMLRPLQMTRKLAFAEEAHTRSEPKMNALPVPLESIAETQANLKRAWKLFLVISCRSITRRMESLWRLYARLRIIAWVLTTALHIEVVSCALLVNPSTVNGVESAGLTVMIPEAMSS